MSTRPDVQPQPRWSAFEWWQSRLAGEFFGEERGGTPVLFFIDEAELRSLKGNAEVDDLSTAVSSVLAWHGNPYSPVTDRCRTWKRGTREEPPPCLPLLAAAVLAAANMRRTTPGPGAPAYYARLAEVLQPSWGGDRYHKPLENHYDAVVEQWILLDEWLREQGGARGLSTIKKNPTYTKVGYAQSQALIRASDHGALNRFFHSSSLSPGEPADGARLLAGLKAWSFRFPKGLSQGLRQALSSDADTLLLQPLLAALYEALDGTTADSSTDGLHQVPLRVVLEDDFTGWDVRWHAEAVPGVDSDALRHPGGILNLTSGAGDQTYALSGAVPGVGEVLRLGFTARGTKTAIRKESGRTILALREDPVAGGWTETDTLTVFEPYIFLFTPSGRPQLQTLLEEAGQRWYRPDTAPVPGWQVTTELQFTDDSALTSALEQAGIREVRHVPGRRLSLRNGLRVKPEWRHRSIFLLGGEPDVMVPQEFRGHGQVTLDGEPLAVPDGGLAALRGLSLAPGQHVLAAGGTETSFYLEQGVRPQPRPVPPAEPAADDPADSVTVPLGPDAHFLTAQGRFLPISRPKEPSWWEARAPGLRHGGRTRVPVPTNAVWLVTISHTGDPTVILLKPVEPDIGALTPAAKDFWRPLVLFNLAGVPHAALWRRYWEAVLSQFPQGGFMRV